jgi:hypothetical protein
LDTSIGTAKGVMVVTTEFELRLIDAPAPSGEIAARDLAALAAALQELTTRIGRDVAGTTGPGRSKQHTEESAQVRLRSVAAGSTVLEFVKGPVGKLDIDLVDETLADNRFWDVMAGIGQDRKPDWMTDLVAESAGKLVNALRSAAPRVIFSAPARPTIEFDSAAVNVEGWLSEVFRTTSSAQVHGRLEKVDLRSHEFRVRDDVGFSVELRHVIDDADVARLVGQWVMAEGEASSNAAGRVVALDNARVHEVADPGAPYVGRYVVTVEEILASALGADMDGGLDLTDEEFEEFLRAARS